MNGLGSVSEFEDPRHEVTASALAYPVQWQALSSEVIEHGPCYVAFAAALGGPIAVWGQSGLYVA